MASLDEYMLERVKEYLDTSYWNNTSSPISSSSSPSLNINALLDEPRYSLMDPSMEYLNTMADLLDNDVFPLKGQLEAKETEQKEHRITPKMPTLTSLDSTIHDVPKSKGEELQHLPTTRKKMRLFLRSHIPMDVWDEDDGYLLVECSLPGIPKDQIILSIDPETNIMGLEIEGQPIETTKIKLGKLLLSERQHPSHRLKRFLHLPKNVNADINPTTSLKDGVLSIRFTKKNPSLQKSSSHSPQGEESWIRKKKISL